MPVQPNSRYRGLYTFEAQDSDGVVRPTIAMRLVGEPPRDPSSFRHVVTAGETMEYLAWRYYSTSEAWWRIADANPRAFPFYLEPGTSIVIPAAGDVGRVERTRRF
ncbi:MAG: LysM peptidoglycan-binding domain-containing protein [Acidobacteria bacterium]|nr:LysM peptidoglycan-binding domain-containing protein [Acidobacteriota bacterium]